MKKSRNEKIKNKQAQTIKNTRQAEGACCFNSKSKTFQSIKLKYNTHTAESQKILKEKDKNNNNN